MKAAVIALMLCAGIVQAQTAGYGTFITDENQNVVITRQDGTQCSSDDWIISINGEYRCYPPTPTVEESMERRLKDIESRLTAIEAELYMALHPPVTLPLMQMNPDCRLDGNNIICGGKK